METAQSETQLRNSQVKLWKHKEEGRKQRKKERKKEERNMAYGTASNWSELKN